MSCPTRPRLQCSLCARTFRRTEHLTRHERAHRNEKPFACAYCEARFTRKDQIKVHALRHHKDIMQDLQEQQQQPVPAGEMTAGPVDGGVSFPQDTSSINWVATDDGCSYNENFVLDNLFANTDLSLMPDAAIGTPPEPITDFGQVEGGAAVIMQNSSSASDSILASIGCSNSALAVPEFTWKTAFDVSETKHKEMVDAIREANLSINSEDDIAVPSTAALRRYILAFFDVFITSLPCIHGPSWYVNEQQPAILLAIAAIGAGTCGKVTQSLALHRAAQMCLWQHLHACCFNPGDQSLWVAQALLFVMLFGSYSGNSMVAREVLAFQSILANITRLLKPSNNSREFNRDDPNLPWASWIDIETTIRTKFAVYVYFSQLHLAFNLPFLLMNSEIHIYLPCSEEEWHASTLEAWARFRTQEKPGLVQFKTALDLLTSRQEVMAIGCSPFAGICLIHAVLQHMWHTRQCSHVNPFSNAVPLLEHTLQKLGFISDIGLKQSPLTNKSLPRALELDAYALVKFAHFVLYANPSRSQPGLLSPDADAMTEALAGFADELDGTPLSSKAALYGTQVLLILFNSGFVWTNKIMTGAASLQFHIISSLQCCFYLHKWFDKLRYTDPSSWTSEEAQIVAATTTMLEEVEVGERNVEKPVHIQLLYGWCWMFRNTGQSGIAPGLVTAVRAFADQLSST